MMSAIINKLFLAAAVLAISTLLLVLHPHSASAEHPAVSFDRYSAAKPPAETARAGQTAEGPPHLDLASCIRIALDHNPAQRAAKADFSAASEAAGTARAPYFPELSLNLGYRRVESHAFLPGSINFPGITTVIGPVDQWNAGLKASYTLFDSGQRGADAESASAARDASAEVTMRTRQTVIFSVSQAYYSLLADLDSKRIATERLARGEDHLRLARERKEAGAVPRADVMRAQVEVANARLSLVRAASSVRIAGGNLNRTMGLSPELPIAIGKEEQPLATPDAINLSEAYVHAGRNRPEVRAADQAIRGSESGVAAARSSFGPRLKAEAGYGWLDSDFLPHDRDWLVGVSLQWPLFSGFASSHNLAKAKAQLARQQADKEQVVLNVQQEVWSAYATLVETFESVQAASAVKADAAESLRLAQARYEAGAGTITDLLDAETAMDNAETTFVQALYSHYIAMAQWQLVLGDL